MEETDVTSNFSTVHVLTVGDNKDLMFPLRQSVLKHNFGYTNLIEEFNTRWSGGDMITQGGGQKVNLVRDWIDRELKTQVVKDSDIVLFVDGYDVVVFESIISIVNKFLEFDCDILFSAESSCWPIEALSDQFPETDDPYRYLNSGLYIGRLGAIRKFISSPIGDSEDDQKYMQLRYILNSKGIKLDTHADLFQCTDFEAYVVDGEFKNLRTGTRPLVYHGNGDEGAKEHFNNIVTDLGYKKEEVESPRIVNRYGYLNTLEYKEVSSDILITPLLTSDKCKEIIQKADALGKWQSLEGDKFPAQEIRVSELGMWDEIEHIWNEKLGSISEKHWFPMEHIGLRDAFVMRYSTDTQTSLGHHTDASLVTGSVKLNSDYYGAELVFPRQEFNNESVVNGACLLFPSQVTHGHLVKPLISGVKYSLTMWTSRYEGDVI